MNNVVISCTFLQDSFVIPFNTNVDSQLMSFFEDLHSAREQSINVEDVVWQRILLYGVVVIILLYFIFFFVLLHIKPRIKTESHFYYLLYWYCSDFVFLSLSYFSFVIVSYLARLYIICNIYCAESIHNEHTHTPCMCVCVCGVCTYYLAESFS